jgi:DNA-binding GntR family transcriptional regulator
LSPPQKTLNRISIVDALGDALRDRILRGELEAGSQLREVELSEQYNVGRHSIRAAFQALAHEGLVRHEPHRGVFVPRMSRADVEDLFLVRTALEVEAVRLISLRRLDIGSAERAVAQLEALKGDEPWDEVTEIDLGFHRALVDVLQSPHASRLFVSLLSELRLLLAQLQRSYVRLEAIGAEHRLLLDALATRSVRKATAAMREHLDVGVQDILETLARPNGK